LPPVVDLPLLNRRIAIPPIPLFRCPSSVASESAADRRCPTVRVTVSAPSESSGSSPSPHLALPHGRGVPGSVRSDPGYSAICCNTLQRLRCAAISTCCDMQYAHAAIRCNTLQRLRCAAISLYNAAVCCDMLRYAAICCNRLRHAAITCHRLLYPVRTAWPSNSRVVASPLAMTLCHDAAVFQGVSNCRILSASTRLSAGAGRGVPNQATRTPWSAVPP
jgi:hypothetical protein